MVELITERKRLSPLHARPVVKRLNWACGPHPPTGWMNSDKVAGKGIDVSCDIREGLPFEPNIFDYIVSIHGVQDLEYFDILPALRELHRVLKPAGVLRLVLPDLDRAIDAYRKNRLEYFYVPDKDAVSPGAKLITQITWYGSVRTPITYDFIREWLLNAGFMQVERCMFKQTRSEFPEIIELDNRERESLFVEAAK